MRMISDTPMIYPLNRRPWRRAVRFALTSLVVGMTTAAVAATPPAQADAAAQTGATGYSQPPKNILDVLHAPSPPSPYVSPTLDSILLVSWQSYPPMSRVATPFLRLAGVRVESRNHSKHDTPGGYGITPCATAFEIVRVAGATRTPIALPAGACPGAPRWAADGQHFAEDLPKFFITAQAQPEALIIGVRDFIAAGCPTHRRRSNAVSTFWFRVETGVRLGDTQCGFRCYPLALTQRLKARSGRYAFELEFMVRASWVGTPIIAVPVKCSYADGIRNSHFRPIKDLAHITIMNIGLVLQSWFVPLSLRTAWSFGERKTWRKTISEFFTDHAHEPAQLAGAVGLGLFFGIAPIWGFQMIAAAAVAHHLRLNKTIALLASNISIPPVMPFILFGALLLGHWFFTGQALEFSPDQMSWAHVREYFWQWFVGSFALAALIGGIGTLLTYVVARGVRKK